MSSPDGNETIHEPRRPSLPDTGPGDEVPPNRRRTVAILAVAVVASLCAGYASASLLGKGGDGGGAAPDTAPSASGETAPSRRPGGTLAATQPPATTVVPGTPPPVSGTPPPVPVQPVPPAAASQPAGEFDAPIPEGWREREFAVPRQGVLQSRWSDPKDSRTDVVINWIDGDRRQPADAAAVLRAGVAGRADYREVKFGPTRGKGWIWVYTLLDERGRRLAHINLVSRRCGVLFAVLGRTPARRFARLQSTFVAVSQGIRIKRRRC